MDDRRKLFLDALSEDAPDLNLSDTALQARWQTIVADARAWRAALETLDEPRRIGWLSGVSAALEVVIGAARGTSRLLDAAANAILPMAPDAWQFQVAPVTRGSGQVPTADTIGEGPKAKVVIDDRRDPKRAIAVVSGLSGDAQAPTLLILSAQADGVTTAKEIAATLTDNAADGSRTLRYEAELDEGRHRFYWGHPQAD